METTNPAWLSMCSWQHLLNESAGKCASDPLWGVEGDTSNSSCLWAPSPGRARVFWLDLVWTVGHLVFFSSRIVLTSSKVGLLLGRWEWSDVIWCLCIWKFSEIVCVGGLGQTCFRFFWNLHYVSDSLGHARHNLRDWCAVLSEQKAIEVLGDGNAFRKQSQGSETRVLKVFRFFSSK